MYKILAKPFFIGKRVVYMPSCHSTNDEAGTMLKKENLTEGTIVITNHQTAGRGQQGNSWEAQPNMNLTFSVILRPKKITIHDHFLLNVIASLAIRNFVYNMTGIRAKVKWPNDIYVDDEKLAGILIANTLKTGSIDSSVIGIGLNVNQISFKTARATSLKLATGQHYILEECFENLVLELEKYYLKLQNGTAERLLTEYMQQLYWLGEVHVFKNEEKEFVGVIQGVDRLGRLHIKPGSGADLYFNFKEVVFVK